MTLYICKTPFKMFKGIDSFQPDNVLWLFATLGLQPDATPSDCPRDRYVESICILLPSELCPGKLKTCHVG